MRKIKIFTHFFNSQKAGGILLIISLIFSLTIANSSLSGDFNNLLSTSLGFSTLKYSLSVWINDGLMAIFFLLVGLEIKRELKSGELSSVQKASLPILSALGGMLVPALIYFIFNNNTETAHGWGIPMATDIAFALAIISLLGKKAPASLKIFLAALAIVDDLGAILVIAIFYTAELHWMALLISGAIFGLLLIFNALKFRSLWLYLPLGLILWYYMHHSGIHATIAGVLLAFTIPSQRIKNSSPLEVLEHQLVKPVNFIIMPIFALANTNITFSGDMFVGLFTNMGLGIILGLFVGKMIGVSLFSLIAVKCKIAKLPSGANWNHIIGVGILAGIGFTMSIFIALLSFKDASHINTAKVAILLASILSGITGYIFLRQIDKKMRVEPKLKPPY